MNIEEARQILDGKTAASSGAQTQARQLIDLHDRIGDGSTLEPQHFAKLDYAERAHLATAHPQRYAELRDQAEQAANLAKLDNRR